MNSTVTHPILAALAYAASAGVSVWWSARLCRTIVPFDDGPLPGRPSAAALIVGSAAVGFALALRDISAPSLAGCALVIASLAACWYSDVRCGIVPDIFTLAPLTIVLASALLRQDAQPLISVLVLLIPFALAALASHGLGMGWGDVKIVALGAAVLNLQTSILWVMGACLAAAAVAMLRGRRMAPIAFAPYLASSIALALTIPSA